MLYQKPRRLTQKRVSESPRENLRDWSIKGVPPARLRAHCYVYISRLVAALSVTPVTSPSPLNGEAVSILNLASHSLPPLTGKAEEAGENDLSPFRTMFAYPPSLFEDWRRSTTLTLPRRVQTKSPLTKLHLCRRLRPPFSSFCKKRSLAAWPFARE